ncbi:hypothetical protein [Humisphaera borealis]|uniref:Uncharacterized protein n=1 Tax=Humisphaera borealis TaxID=2807512 RepID=A0A7M2WZA7_9BACT|nr:hypothetical protein [Humisphaera borealis]QOV90769.1 hypothetical protein IPV69_05265 [Humisphaera borealis]
MTTIEQKPQSQSTYSPTQSGQESPVTRQPQQGDNRAKSDRSDRAQSGQQDESSFTISADDFMMM